MKIGAFVEKIIREYTSLMIVTVLVLLFFVIYFWNSIFITIQAGEGGVLYRRFFGGTVVDKVYPEGFHVIAPWDTMTRYNVRYQVIHHEMNALSQKGMRIGIILTIRYKPEYRLLGVLHQNVGPDYPAKIVTPEAEAVIRKIIGEFDAEEVYATKRALIQRIVNEAVAQIAQRYVRIDDMLITRVELPETIRKAIEAKLEERELTLAYEFKLEKEKKEAERKKIEAGGYHEYNSIVDASLTDKILAWRGIQATLELARSNNAKVVIIGSGRNGLPLILDTKDWGASPQEPVPDTAKGVEGAANRDNPAESGPSENSDKGGR